MQIEHTVLVLVLLNTRYVGLTFGVEMQLLNYSNTIPCGTLPQYLSVPPGPYKSANLGAQMTHDITPMYAGNGADKEKFGYEGCWLAKGKG